MVTHQHIGILAKATKNFKSMEHTEKALNLAAIIHGKNHPLYPKDVTPAFWLQVHAIFKQN